MNNNNNEEVIYKCNYCDSEFTEDDLNNDRIGELHGEYVCEDCLQEHFIWCDDEGEYVHEDDAVQVYTDGYQRNWEYASEDYASRNYIWSNYDNCYYKDDDCGYYTYNQGFVGMASIDNDFRSCEDCGDILSYDELEEIDGCYYCSSCVESHRDEGLIYSYHDFSDWQLFKNDDEEQVPYYIGFELEIDNNHSYNLRDVHDAIIDNINCVLMHDGSLSDNGIEIVSHPQSYNYICNQEDKYKMLFDKLTSEYGFTSHENERCGLHFHVTRPSDEVVDRVQLILENFKEELIVFSRRTENQLNRWSSFLSDKTYDVTHKELLSTLTIKKLKDLAEDTRYMALNLRNRNTIEFRFIRGSLKYSTFRASVDLINNIMKYASDLSLDLTTLSWSDLVNTDYARNYCIERGIKSIKKLIDNTAKILKRDADAEEYKKQYIDLLEKYKKLLIKEYNSTDVKISNIDDLSEKCRAINTLYNRITEIDDFKKIHYDNVDRLINGMNYTLRYVSSNYYIKKLNKLVKEAKEVCVL